MVPAVFSRGRRHLFIPAARQHKPGASPETNSHSLAIACHMHQRFKAPGTWHLNYLTQCLKLPYAINGTLLRLFVSSRESSSGRPFSVISKEEAPSFLYQPREDPGGGCSLPAANQCQFFTSIETLPPNMSSCQRIHVSSSALFTDSPFAFHSDPRVTFRRPRQTMRAVPTHHSGQRLWSEKSSRTHAHNYLVLNPKKSRSSKTIKEHNCAWYQLEYKKCCNPPYHLHNPLSTLAETSSRNESG